MQVFLIRHGEAAPDGSQLTPHGRAQARALGDRLRWYDCVPTCIVAAPSRAAAETAEVIAAAVDAAVAIEVAAAAELAAALRALPDDAVAVVVGDAPELAALAAAIVVDRALAALRPCEAARIVEGRLRWRFAWDGDAPVRG